MAKDQRTVGQRKRQPLETLSSGKMAPERVVQEIIDDLVRRILAGYAPQKVILFGSYAYGDPQPGSDIDLLIVKETSDRLIDRYVAVRRILSDPKRKVPVELLVLTPRELANRLAIGDQFLADIVEKGKIIYAA